MTRSARPVRARLVPGHVAPRPGVEATLFPALIVDEDVEALELTYQSDRAKYLLTSHGAHVPDGLRFLLGEPVDVSAQPASPARTTPGTA